MDAHNGLEALHGGEIFKVVRVGDLAGGPLALVGRAVNHGRVPLALVVGVGLVGAGIAVSLGMSKADARIHTASTRHSQELRRT